MIRVKPFGGLGNRIRVLYSVLLANRELEDQIEILWDCNRELNCPFEELFEIPENCMVKNIQPGLYKSFNRFFIHKLHFSKFRNFIYDLILYDDDIRKIRNKNKNILSLFGNHSSIYLETCLNFFRGSSKVGLLAVQPSIQEEAKKIYRHFNSNTYGLHIRSTDNVMSKKYSPPDLFKNFINKKLNEENDAMFFLATDSKKIEKEFQSEFKDSVITNHFEDFDRNSKKGIKNALIDMVCLSETKKVYGSYYSSFSHISASLTGIEYENLRIDRLKGTTNLPDNSDRHS